MERMEITGSHIGCTFSDAMVTEGHSLVEIEETQAETQVEGRTNEEEIDTEPEVTVQVTFYQEGKEDESEAEEADSRTIEQEEAESTRAGMDDEAHAESEDL